jgi:hypothetical protein
MADRESGSSWKDFLLGLRQRGLNGVELWSLTITLAFAPPSERSSPRGGLEMLRRLTSATPSIICGARRTTPASWSCVGCTTGKLSKGPIATCPPRSPNGATVIDARRLDRGNLHFLPTTPPAAIGASRAPTCLNGSTRRSRDETTSRSNRSGRRGRPATFDPSLSNLALRRGRHVNSRLNPSSAGPTQS